MRRPNRIPVYQIDPDEVLLDARNLPSFNTQQFEGRIERPISKTAFYVLGLLCALACLLFLGKIGQLQLVRGSALAARSVNNTLRHIPVFAERGLITDRNDVELAWNTPTRTYIDTAGFGHLIGYVGRPNEQEVDSTEIHPDSLVGRDGVEKHYDRALQGESGIKIEEVNATGEVLSDYILRPPTTGQNLTLAIDSRLQGQFYKSIKEVVDRGIFVAGAAVMMDLKTGEVLVMTSAPEFDPNVISQGSDRAAINSYLTNKNQPFLNRVIDGLYTPGSIVKPIMALAALQEGVVTPETKILSTGSISVANPYNPAAPTIFKDWRAHGWVNLREALAVSSDVYFYAVGGGYEKQRGIGIAKIDKYAQMFGLGLPTGIDFLTEEVGVIPTPEWKAKTFNNDPWRIGNTYHTAIGQYGYQVTPLQMVRAVAAVATSGKLLTPTMLKQPRGYVASSTQITEIKPEYYQIVREGMRQSVTTGISTGLNMSDASIAVKTGTAELGVSKAYVNSWITGFFPYESPRYAYALVLERGLRDTQVGSVYVSRQFFDWLAANAPEYLAVDPGPETR